MTRLSDYHRRQLFLRTYGPSPWPCAFCRQEVEKLGLRGKLAGLVHHLDGNHDNDAPENLSAAHRGCHTTYHLSGRVNSLETRLKRGASLRGKPLSAEHRAKLSAARTGLKLGPRSEETKRKISESMRRSWGSR